MRPEVHVAPVIICLSFLCMTTSSLAGRELSPSLATWFLRDDGRICVLMRFAASFRIAYRTSDSTRLVLLQIPDDASLTSRSGDGRSCVTDRHGYLTLDLSFGRETDGLHNLVTRFRKLDDTSYQLRSFELQYVVNPREFPGHWQSNGTLMSAFYSTASTA